MQKMYICSNCRNELPRDSFESPRNKNGKSYKPSKCKECTWHAKRLKNNHNVEKYFGRICTNQRYSHKKKLRGKDPDGFALTPEDLTQIWEQQEGKCAYSNVLMTYHRDGISKVDLNASLDRKDPERGYTLDNVHLVCNRVNTMKHTLGEDMFIWWIKNIAEHLLAK